MTRQSMTSGTRRIRSSRFSAISRHVAVILPICGAWEMHRADAGTPSEVGRWLEPQPWPVTAIHAAMLPTGKVLHYSFPNPGPGSLAVLWDPVGGGFEDVSLSADLFCSGHCFLPDGRLYVTGGNDYECDFQGRKSTHIFHPSDGTWTQLEEMTVGRWYPTNVVLGDGRIMIFSGHGRDCKTTDVAEMYTPGAGLTVIPEAQRFMNLYPRMHLLSDGRIAHVGEESFTYTYDPATLQWEFVGFNIHGWRSQCTSILVPGETDEIMVFGRGLRDLVRPVAVRVRDVVLVRLVLQVVRDGHGVEPIPDSFLRADGGPNTPVRKDRVGVEIDVQRFVALHVGKVDDPAFAVVMGMGMLGEGTARRREQQQEKCEDAEAHGRSVVGSEGV